MDGTTRGILTWHFMKRKNNLLKLLMLAVVYYLIAINGAAAQMAKTGKKISPDLFGLFFEDINYSADGGLYAEMVQNRSFEYNPTERTEWNPFSFWEYTTTGYSYGNISVENTAPVHPNNPHYMVLTIEHIGTGGVGLKNYGFDGMVVKAGESYHFSMMARQLSSQPVSLSISLQNRKGKILAESSIVTSASEWKKYTTQLNPKEGCDSATLVVLATTEGKLALDVVSLFPEKTFKNRANGLRADLAQMLADVKPHFIRFPGGCLAHGDGLANMYRWKIRSDPSKSVKSSVTFGGIIKQQVWVILNTFSFVKILGPNHYPSYLRPLAARIPAVPGGLEGPDNRHCRWLK